MKRSQYFLPALIFLLFISVSCNKESNCQCINYIAGHQQSGSQTNFKVKGTKSKRQKLCDERSTKPNANGMYTDCVLK